MVFPAVVAQSVGRNDGRFGPLQGAGSFGFLAPNLVLVLASHFSLIKALVALIQCFYEMPPNCLILSICSVPKTGIPACFII